MKRLVVRGGLVLTPVEERLADVWIEQDKIVALGDFKDKKGDEIVVDASSCYVTPALFDIQVNGGPECDFWADLSKSKITNFSRRLLSHGIGTILPTLITGDISQLQKNRDFLKTQIGLSLGRQFDGEDAVLRMPGVHFEGPCISPQKPGVHPPQFLQALSIEILKKLVDENTKLITLAPELDPSGECLSFLNDKNIKVAIGHSNASYEEALNAFERGVKIMTHTFNALPSIHHRKPGAVTAALLNRALTCCVIPDGLHVEPALVDMILRLKGIDKCVLVSDVASVGTSQGGLVGSSILLDDAVRNVVKWGLSTFREAIVMGAYNPAKLLGLEKEIGSIAPSAYADIVLWDKHDLSIKQVIFNGSLIGSKGKSSVLSA